MNFDLYSLVVNTFCVIEDLTKDSITKNKVGNKPKLLISELTSIIVAAKIIGLTVIKKIYYFILSEVENERSLFYNAFKMPSYEQFTRLIKKGMISIKEYIDKFIEKFVEKTSTYHVIDSTALPINQYGGPSCKWGDDLKLSFAKNCYGWYQGYKLHLIINENNEIIFYLITSANIHDVKIFDLEPLYENINGLLLADKGYIAREDVRNKYNKNNLRILTNARSNMPEILSRSEKRLLSKKRNNIESINSTLKNDLGLINNRSRTEESFLYQVLASIFAFLIKKHFRLAF